MELLNPEQVKALLVSHIPDATVTVEDLTGTRDHYKVIIVTKAFDGLSLIKRHQMVNEALKEPLKGPIHALTIEAYTPEQWTAKAAEKPRFGGIKIS